MKIALVSAYDYAHPGGVTEHVRHLAAGLRRRGHDVTVFAPCSDREVAERDSDFIRVGRPFPIPMHGSVARISVSLQITNRIKHCVRDGSFDVIHYHEPLMPVLPVTALRYSKTTNIGTFHAFARSNVGYYYGKPLLKRYVRRLHVRIAVSNPAREFVRHYFPGDYRVIPNGIDVSRFQNQQPYQELSDGMVNLLFVGRLEYRKGLGYLLRAYAQLKPQYPKLRLIIVGDGPLRRWYGTFSHASSSTTWSWPATCRQKSCLVTTPAAIFSAARPPATRASASSCWKRWHPESRSSPPASTASAKS